jgi:hypothetical protein
MVVFWVFKLVAAVLNIAVDAVINVTCALRGDFSK